MHANVMHVFLLNPAAGKGHQQADLPMQIEQACRERAADFEIHYTSARGDATAYVRELCQKNPDTQFRFYACGGDGTLSEAVNGAYGFDHAAVGVIPVGTGNDFVRNFGKKEAFMDMGAQIDGEVQKFDLLRYNGNLCANMINIGFDCEVVKMTSRIKRNKLIPAGMGYIAGLIITLIRKPGVTARVSVDGGEVQERRMLLTSVANGAWCGGGFHSSPLALLQDGILDILLIKNVSRIRFLSLVGAYKKGSFIHSTGARRVIDYAKCKNIRYIFDKTQSICVDGEIAEVDELYVDSVSEALSFIVPKGATYAPAAQSVPAEVI